MFGCGWYSVHLKFHIREGDYVWSEDETDVLVHLMTKSGTEIDTTEGHPFYVEGKGWVRAENLENGAMFITQDGNTSIKRKAIIIFQ